MDFVDPVHRDPVDLVHGSVDLVQAFFFKKIIPKIVEIPWVL
jgi:hypothetical protein